MDDWPARSMEFRAWGDRRARNDRHPHLCSRRIYPFTRSDRPANPWRFAAPGGRSRR